VNEHFASWQREVWRVLEESKLLMAVETCDDLLSGLQVGDTSVEEGIEAVPLNALEVLDRSEVRGCADPSAGGIGSDGGTVRPAGAAAPVGVARLTIEDRPHRSVLGVVQHGSVLDGSAGGGVDRLVVHLGARLRE
jgi:hypothetical protein